MVFLEFDCRSFGLGSVVTGGASRDIVSRLYQELLEFLYIIPFASQRKCFLKRQRLHLLIGRLELALEINNFCLESFNLSFQVVNSGLDGHIGRWFFFSIPMQPKRHSDAAY